MLMLDKVLHVEDNADIRFFIRHYFGKEWARIDEADTAREAIRLIEATGNNYQLIILDLGLRDSGAPSSVEACVETIRLVRACTVAPIVIHTGAVLEIVDELDRRSRELGVFGIISKGTFSSDRVRAIIENAVRKWREERFTATIDALTAQIDSVTEHRRKVLRELAK
jgi:DNA-binding response OmpR family regulator